jgi:hypothetical protein
MYATKPSTQETYERRIKVFRMKMRGLSHTSIAKELSVTRNAIIRDAKWIQEHFTQLAADADRNSEMGMAMAKLEEIEKEAMFNYSETENPKAKNDFLLTAITACEKRIKLMMDAGIISKAPVDLNLTMDFSKMSTEELVQRRREVVNRLATFGVAAAMGADGEQAQN